MPGNRCTICITSGLDCTHAEITKTLGSAKGYVESLETRLERMEQLLNKLLPGIDFTEQLEHEDEPGLLDEGGPSGVLPRNDADHLSEAIDKLTLNPEEHRFFGKSSGIQFVLTALNFKSHIAGPNNITQPVLPKRRNEYWEPIPWLLPSPDEEDNPQYTFPDPDLIPSLLELYFTHVNCYYPVLHRPTFERKVKDHLHLRDHRFAATLLMACSLGSRHSEDPRVFLDGTDNLHTAGWKWHNQVRVIPQHLIYKPNLYELQTIALSSLFLMIISPVAWNQIGFGLRRAQDVGAHRRMKQAHPTAEHEQWKRVFWVLLCLDWFTGTTTGRPLAMHYQDYDQDLPVDCDDEYWDLPEPQNFRQPKDRPSEISFFIRYAKLLEIQASVINTIYSPRKPRDLAGRPLPPSSDAANAIAFDSCISINRQCFMQPFIMFKSWSTDLTFPLHWNLPVQAHFLPRNLYQCGPFMCPIIHAQERLGVEPNPNMLPAVSISAIVLLLHTWSGKRSGFAYNPSKEMEGVYKCIEMATRAEKRDSLIHMISVGNMNREYFTKPFYEATAPPSAQEGYEQSMFTSHPQPFESSDPAAFTWPTSVTQDLNDRVEASLAQGSNPDSGVMDMDQLMHQDQQEFPSDMLIDSDVMSMWSTTAGFQFADWESYIMNTAQVDGYSEANQYSASLTPGQLYPPNHNPTDDPPPWPR
ncbi:fungal-specific transcription factor domain-containing protein [Mycena leptocephala]|nr:fungal-specific transcription factor domain-containing protein [Mycena leptocephala]